MTIRMDNFQRANESPVASPWAIMNGGGVTGSWDLTSLEALYDDNGVDGIMYRTEAWGEAQSSEIMLTSTSTDVGVAVRCTSGGQAVKWHIDSGDIEVNTGSGFSFVATRSGGFAAGSRYRIEADADGTTIRVYKDNAQVGADVTISSMSGGTPGVGGYSTGDKFRAWWGTGCTAGTLTFAGTAACRFPFDEAASGTAPSTIVDISGNDYDLDDVVYSTTMNFDEDADGNRGLESTDETGNHYAKHAINDTSDAVRDVIYDNPALTLEVKVDLTNGNTSGGRIFGVNDDVGSDGTFILKADNSGNSGIAFAIGNTAVGSSIDLDPGPHTVHMVYDTAQTTQADRLRIYIDGVLRESLGATASIGLNDVLTLSSGLDLIALNRESSSSYARSIVGVLYHGAIIDAALTGTQVANNTALLLYDDDTPASGDTREQEGFRAYNDDGSESAATAYAAQDTNIIAPADTTLRLRFLIDATGDPATTQYKLQFRKTGGSWADIA